MNLKNLVFLFCLCISISFAADVSYDKSKNLKDKGSVKFDDSMTARKVVDEMGFGWNLGNTLDAFDSNHGQNQGLFAEQCWGAPVTTPAMIADIAKKGFKTIRLPTTWHCHLIDNNYTIDPEWTGRIKELVDTCIKNGLYVILNTHHDNDEKGAVSYGTGYYPNKKNKEASEKYLVNIWSQIAEAFNNGYDHHLIFEGLNEPRPVGDQYEWWYMAGAASCEESISVLNDFNKLILETIRKSGGNNEKRFYMVSPISAAHSYLMANNFQIPDDSKYNHNIKILISVHMYTPYSFAMDPNGNKDFTDADRKELETSFNQLHEKFVKKGYYIVIGEMGTINKNNLSERIKWAKYYLENSRRLGMCSVVWDNGYFGDAGGWPADTWGLFHRQQGTWEPEELVNTYISAAKTAMN